MKHKLSIVQQILHMLYEICCCSLLFAFIEVIFIKQEPHLFLLAVTAACFGYSYLLRSVVTQNWILLLTHLLPGFGVFALPISKETQVLYCIEIVYLFFVAVKYNRNQQKNAALDIPWPSFLLCFLVYLVSDYLHNSVLHTLSYVIALVLLLLYLALIYAEGIEQYLNTTRTVADVPLRQILSVNTIMVGAIIFCLAVGLVAGELFDLKKILGMGLEALLAIVRVIAKLIGMFFHVVSFWFRGGEAETSVHPEFEEEGVSEVVSSAGEMLEPLLYIGLGCLLVFLLYKGIGRLVHFLMRRRIRTQDTVEVISIKKEKTQKKDGKRTAGFSFSRRERARRYYKDCIERYRYEIDLKQTKTSTEIAGELSEKALADVTELTDCYEKIRYADAVVDRGMLQKVRKLAK